MKSKALVALLFISGMLVTSECFAIKDAPKNKAKATEEAVFDGNIQYTNDVHSDFSLEDCIRIAIKNNLHIQSSTVNEAIYKEKIGLAWSTYFPELSAGVSWGRNKEIFYETYNKAYMPQLSADMTIFDFGKAKANADSAKSTYQSKTLETQENINLLICAIKKAYFNLLFAQAQYDVYKDTVADFTLQRKQAYSLYSAGKKAKVDVAFADYNLCKAQLNFEKAKNVLKVARLELSRLMGFPKYTNYTLTNNLSKDVFAVDLEEALNGAYEVRPEILAATKEHEAAKLNLRAKRREFTPDISINASWGNDIGTHSFASYGFGANLSYSNFNIMRTKKLINEARYQLEKSQLDLEDLKHTLFLNVSRAYENFNTTQESIAIAANALEQAKEQYRQTNGRYKAGVADIVELKDSENTYLNARLDYYNSLLNYNVSIAELEKEVGAPIVKFSNKNSQEL